MPDVPPADESVAASRLSTCKVSLVLCHLFLLPWFVRCCCRRGLPFLSANPALDIGGLPIAPKLSRYGTDPPYIPSLLVDSTTERSTLTAFAADHSFPLVSKPQFGSQSRDVQKIDSVEQLCTMGIEEPTILQPYIDAPKEYGINVMRVGSRIKIYGLTEVNLSPLRENEAPGSDDPLFRDRTEQVTVPLRAACKQAADQIGLRFGRFDVKAKSLEALQRGEMHILEANGSTSLDLTLYDGRHPLSVRTERLRAHWELLFQQSRSCQSPGRTLWHYVPALVRFLLNPKRYASSFRNEVDQGDLTAGP